MLRTPILLVSSLAYVCGLRIAVIGGGIGGTASAYFLRQLVKSPLDIHVFESSKVGGRLASVSLGGREYEAGGSIIHPRNRHVLDLVKELGLKHRASPPEALTAFYDGKDIVYEETGWAWWDLARATIRYGPLTLYNANKQLQKMLAEFERIYPAQESGRGFTTVTELLDYMSPDFKHLATSAASKMDKVSPEFVNEIVGAATRVNYAQWPSTATQFVAFVSLAAAEGGLWAVEGGNWRLPQMLLAASKATHRPQHVDAVIQAPGGGFNLTLAEGAENFDAVLVAAPLVKGGVELPLVVERRAMEGVWVTLVESDGPRADAFGGRKLQDVISVGPTWFNCLARVHPVNEPIPAPPPSRPVYKIFSSEKPTQEQVKSVLSGVGSMEQRHFWAYPHYEWERSPDGPLELLPGLVHTNAIEWAASAMEMSAIAAKNAALLLAAHFNPQSAPITDAPTTTNEEL